MESNRENGTYPPKGFKVPNREKSQFKPGEAPADRYGRRKANKMLKKAQETRNETIRKERRRIIFGLPQKTKLKLVSQSSAHVNFRYNLKRRNYLIDDDEGVAYYDKETKRSERMEHRQQSWYTFEEMEG